MTPKLNILHLYGTEYSSIRQNNFMQQLAEQEITDFKIWPGIYDKGMPHRGISRSHKQIIKHAKENQLSYVCVMEDDCAFLGKGAFAHYIKNMPSEYDIYLGSVSNIIWKEGGCITDFRGLTLYAVHERFYDAFLSATEDKDLDAAFRFLGKYYLCPEVVCYQIDGYSYRKKKSTQYSKLINQYRKYAST